MFGGTYWPGPNSSKSQLGFQEVLEKIIQTWKEQPAKCLASAEEILHQLREFADEGLKGAGEGHEENLELDLLEDAYQQFNTRYDSVHGGFGRMFPHVLVKWTCAKEIGSSSQIPRPCQTCLFVTAGFVPLPCQGHHR
jgi:uncharacterized protein YyaL (SSP411 family)